MYQNVCLVNPPWTQRPYSLWKEVEGRAIPFGLGYVAAVLERESQARVSIIDAKAEDLTLEETVRRIVKISPDIVGISTFTYDYNDGIKLSHMIKEKTGAVTCLGGAHATVLPKPALETSCIDFVVRGEGEFSFLELVQGYPLKEIRGLSYKNKGKIIHNPDRHVIENLDNLPRLSYHLLPMEKYTPTAGQCRRLPAAALLVSRGCPGRCIFCRSSTTGKSIRRFSPGRILDEVLHLVNNYSIREVVFMDDTMTFPREEMVALCNLLITEELDMIWDCSTRVDHVDESLLQLMKRAGCNQVSFGIESGDDGVLRSIRKGHHTGQVRKAAETAKKCGLEVRGSFILGFPEDTTETIERTITFSRELGLDLASFYIATPYPGTAMFAWAETNGKLLTRNWSLYDQSHYIMDLPYTDQETVENLYQKAWRAFYLRPGYLFHRLTSVRSIHDIMSAYRAVKGVLSAGWI